MSRIHVACLFILTFLPILLGSKPRPLRDFNNFGFSEKEKNNGSG